MKIRLSVILCLLAVSLHGTAMAEDNPAPFETQTALSIGSPIGLAFLDVQKEPTTSVVMMHVAQRFRLPRYTPFALELNMVNGYGAGANLLIDAYRNGRLRIHVFDVGYTRWFDREQALTVSRLPRSWDLSFGFGAEIMFPKEDDFWFIADYRIYLPNPVMIEQHYGSLGRQYVDESLKGGMWCVGLAYSW